MERVKEELITDAVMHGICSKGQEKMRSSDIDELIDYYIENPDWCMERDYPTLPYLREHFSRIEERGVFVDKVFNGELLNEQQVYIFHNCTGMIRVGLNVEKQLIPMLYFGNNCRMRIRGIGEDARGWSAMQSILPIYQFGKNEISARDNRHIKFARFKTDMI